MPRDRRSTSFTASCSLLYGHMRRPPSAGPSTVLWIAMMALRPASLLWQKTTSSWPVVASVSKIIGVQLRERKSFGAWALWPSSHIASGRDERGRDRKYLQGRALYLQYPGENSAIPVRWRT